MQTVILVTRHDTGELRALMEGSLGGQASVVVFSSLNEIFPDILRLDPILALIDGRALADGDMGTIQSLKKTYPNLKVLLTFHIDQRDLAARALMSGVDAYILEPYYISEFSQLLKREFKTADYQSRRVLDLRMDALSAFVEGLAPEVNNPLTTIRGFLQILLAGDADKMKPEEIDEIYTLMEKESRRIGQIVLELENFSRTRRPKRLPVVIHALIERALSEALKEAKAEISVSTDLEECPEKGMLDQNQILSALKSLLGFLAAGADAEKGRILIKASRATAKGFLAVTIEGRNTVSLGQDVQRAFVPLYTRKIIKFREELGLASAYGIIRGHGGSINVTSRKDGCLFQIELPYE